MRNKKLLVVGIILMFLSQWIVPLNMILESEETIASGNAFRFRVVPVDPDDPFRGKYLDLGFRDNTCEVKNINDWHSGEMVYAIVGERQGYAFVKSIQKEVPSHASYFKVKIDYPILDSNRKKVLLKFPFHKFYVEESQASQLEKTYRSMLSDTANTVYAIVYIKDGYSVLQDIQVGDSSVVK